MAETPVTAHMVERTFERMVNLGEIHDARLRVAAETALAMADDDRGMFFWTAARLVNGVPQMGALLALEVLTRLGYALALTDEGDVRAAAIQAAAAPPDDAELERQAWGCWPVALDGGEGAAV